MRLIVDAFDKPAAAAHHELAVPLSGSSSVKRISRPTVPLTGSSDADRGRRADGDGGTGAGAFAGTATASVILTSGS